MYTPDDFRVLLTRSALCVAAALRRDDFPLVAGFFTRSRP